MPVVANGFTVELLNALAPQNPADLSDTDNTLEALDSTPLDITVSTVQGGSSPELSNCKPLLVDGIIIEGGVIEAIAYDGNVDAIIIEGGVIDALANE